MADVFISYARADKAAAEAVARRLDAEGITAWWDSSLVAGDSWSETIRAELKAATVVVVLWSRTSWVSQWVQAEAHAGHERGALVAARLDDVALEPPFNIVQTADLCGLPVDAACLDALLSGVRRKIGRGGAPAAPGAAPQPAKPPEAMLAVLPFDNLSGDPEMGFFSDGVSEEILGRLTRGSKLKVIGRTSSFQFRGADKAKAAAALKASHVLDGSIRRAGGRVRISAHLVEAESLASLWSDRYDRGLEDVFAVQDEISEAIADALDTTFFPVKSDAVDPAAYDLYLQASPKSYAPDELRASVGLLEVATQRAPSLTEAWGRLAYLRSWLRFYQPYSERKASAALVANEAAKALEDDPDNIEALVAQYFTVAPFGDFIAADALMERVRRTPGSSELHMFAGWHDRALGRVCASAEPTERAYRLDALNPLVGNMTALGLMATGRHEEAVPILEEQMARAPDMSFPVANLLRALAFLGDWDAVDRLLDPRANRPLREFQDGLIFIKAKRDPTPENLGAMREALEAPLRETGSIDLSHLVYAAHLGLVDEAYRAVETAHIGPRGTRHDIIGPDAYRTGILFWYSMPELRDDPRFVTLCARLGLVEFWRATGKWPDCADDVPYDFKGECEKGRDIPKEIFGL